MPQSALEFVEGGLAVRYRANDQLQELFVDIEVEPSPREPFSRLAMACVTEAINRGGAGSDVFPPSGGFAEVLDGPTPEQEMQTIHRWRLRVAGVAPRFVRNVVAEMRRSGFDKHVRQMSIVGTVAMDTTPMTVNETIVREWFAQGQYPEAWPNLPFTVEAETNAASGADATFRLTLADAISATVRKELEFTSVRWLNCIRNYPDEDGEENFFNPDTMLPYFGQGRREFTAFFPKFAYVGAPARAMLKNLLARFHHDVAPIIAVEISV